MTKNNKVLLGMSGGVDSSSAAVILQQSGYEVIGTTFIQLDESTMTEAIADAKKVADLLGIEHFVMDLRKEFKEEIIDYFYKEYEQGRTPNPCVKCNKEIKYKKFIEKANELGIYHIASGQYVKIDKNSTDGRQYIKKASNLKKDQSYYLYNFKESDLNRLLMPLGEIESKDIARQILKDKGITFSDKKESQEICFIKDDDYISFIEQYFNPSTKLGNYIDKNGNVLGKHEGIHKYTIGQRKGLGIALGTPHYVTEINPKTNEVTLGLENELYRDECNLKEYNIIYNNYNLKDKEFSCKIRYSAKETKAIIEEQASQLKITFKEPVKALTQGQSLVFYDGDILVGGGIIL
jgi:tRNA-specific 2-thiouridylase